MGIQRQQVKQIQKINALRHLKTLHDLLYGQGDNKYDENPDFIDYLREAQEYRSLQSLNKVMEIFDHSIDVMNELREDIIALRDMHNKRIWLKKNNRMPNLIIPLQKANPDI